LDLYGPTAVVQGHDLYVGVSSVLLTGTKEHLFFDTASGLPPGVTVHVLCNFNPNISNERADSFWDDKGRQWCYYGNDENFMVRVRTSAATPPGSYVVRVRTEAVSVAQSLNIVIDVAPPPSGAFRPSQGGRRETNPRIPGFEVWQEKMLTLGEKWCAPTETMSFGYYSQIWFYDGGRTYFQLSDYTKQPAQWEPCAYNIIEQYREYVLQVKGAVQAYSAFPHGLAMKYWRTGDMRSRDAVLALANGSPYSAKAGGVSVNLIRETAYLIEVWTLAERLGERHDLRLDRAVDFGLGHINQLVSQNGTILNQPFYDGLMAEALIQYYEATKDSRIPGAVKQLLDCVWAKGWDGAAQGMLYSTLEVPKHYATDLTALIAPAFAWYWALTGESVYRDRGDQLFQAGITQDISYSAKSFNQAYRWSFDYVRWRQDGMQEDSAFLLRAASPSPAVVAVTFDTALNSGIRTHGTVWLSKVATQSTTIHLSQAETPQRLQVPPSVTVSSGTQHAKFAITPNEVTHAETTTVIASGLGATVRSSTVVTPGSWGELDVSSVWVPPSVRPGGANITVYLTTSAPAGGATVSLTSSNNRLIALPATAEVPAGKTFVDVPVMIVEAAASQAIVIQVTIRKTVRVTIQVLSSKPLEISSLWAPSVVTAGPVDITVYLTGPAPPGGATVTLTCHSTLIRLPEKVQIPAGRTWAYVPITVEPVTTGTSVTIQGTLRRTASVTLAVRSVQ
jgi:hypothetical protein